MKKLIIPVVTLTLTLVSCSSEEEKVNASLGRLEKIGSDDIGSGIDIFRDKETGCQYMNISAGYGQVIEPMVQADGKPYCPKKK
ncbi:hypothetical protein P9294_gp065 [Bacillus phage FADO]|uniref:DUF6440 domain-containing protein n=1 Tax=Bacillus phage FADO TaxID=2917160 RepID=A0AAE9G6F4_9CAUD|nr:hypothetical protein P9294_gp065 [Bacillus phage FADO]UNY48780.1 hypothetical protein fado_65 [Bacillus phage FADO]